MQVPIKINYIMYFKEKILSQQAEWERVRPVKPFLDNVREVIKKDMSAYRGGFI